MLMLLILLSFLQFLAHRTFYLWDIDQMRLKMAEDIVFFTDHFRSINIVPFKSCQQCLRQLSLVDCLVCGQLKVGVLLCNSAQTDPLNHLSSPLKSSDVNRAIHYFRHLLNLCLCLILRFEKIFVRIDLIN